MTTHCYNRYKGELQPYVNGTFEGSYLQQMYGCGQDNMNTKCFGAYRGPIMKNAVFGGYDEEGTTSYLNTTRAVIFTFVVTGNIQNRTEALAWELAFSNFMKEQKSDLLDISFNCERGLEDELDRASHADIMTIVISYILMFVYVSTTLGKMSSSVSSCMIQSKVTRDGYHGN
eukprot:sb/3472099/